LDPGSLSLLLGLLICLALAGIASAADAALSTLSRYRLNNLVDAGAVSAKMIADLLDDPARLKATTLTVNTFAICGVTALSLALLNGQSPRWQLLLGVLLILLVLLIVGEALPKLIATTFPDRTALFLARPLYILHVLVRPITAMVGFVVTPFAHLLGSKPDVPLVTEEELKLLVHAGAEEGVLEQEEREMIEGILIFGDTVVREVMVPRIDIVALDERSTVSQALDLALAKGHSRIPVYQDTIDQIVGVLYVRDLLPLLKEGRLEAPINTLLRPAYVVPESMKVDELLRSLKKRKVHLAIVVDEYGGTAGLVTIEDLLEEIVGEIQDEYDVEEPLLQHIDANTWLVAARVSLDDFNQETGLHLETEEGDTLGGLVYEKLARIPVVGDSVEVDDVVITVQSVQGLRPEKLQIMVRSSSRALATHEVGDRAG
jgi:putative hemolysin